MIYTADVYAYNTPRQKQTSQRKDSSFLGYDTMSIV